MSRKEQLAYVLINPYTIHKSRTGGVISRLFTRTGLELVAARMFAPSKALVDQYSEIVVSAKDPQDRKIQELIRRYILENYSPNPKTGQRHRVMMLLFRGEDAVKKIRQCVGNFFPSKSVAGETIRDTYGDFVSDANGDVRYFEPAVLAAPSAEEAEEKLKLWAKFSDTDGGYLDDVVSYPANTNVQETLVLLKPDNFRFPSARPGNIIDMLSRTGLYIIGVKAHCMSLAEGLDFYGPLQELLRKRLAEVAGKRARKAIEQEFQFPLSAETEKALAGIMAPIYGDSQFGMCIEFMTGLKPEQATPETLKQPGKEKILALVYQGVDAVEKIRSVLGPTDPRKAPPGTVRKELGQDVMVNAAHASDSPESAKREIKIINPKANDLKQLVEEFYSCKL